MRRVRIDKVVTEKYTISGVYSSQGPYLYMDIPTERIGGTDHICLQGLFSRIIPQNSIVTLEITVKCSERSNHE